MCRLKKHSISLIHRSLFPIGMHLRPLFRIDRIGRQEHRFNKTGITKAGLPSPCDSLTPIAKEKDIAKGSVDVLAWGAVRIVSSGVTVLVVCSLRSFIPCSVEPCSQGYPFSNPTIPSETPEEVHICLIPYPPAKRFVQCRGCKIMKLSKG